MINTTEKAEHLINILKDEIELINGFAKIENTIMDSVINNSWDGLQASICRSEDISLELESLEMQRENSLNSIREITGLDADSSFYRITVELETETREQVNDLFRVLKLSVLNVQNITWRIDTYLSTVTGIMKQTLKEIYPNRRGSLYSKSGIIKEADSNPMVLNKKL